MMDGERRGSSMQARIRAYELSDAADVLALSLRAWQPVFASLEAVLGTTIFRRLHPDWRADQSRAVGEVLASETNEVWVARSGDHLSGLVAVELRTETNIGEIYMLAVDPAFQSEGVGARLTEFALDRMAGAGMAIAMVETGGDTGHAPARRTYENAGFSLLPVARYFKAL
jgi:ribosomal protein S18 acetylase RimI-like enzyme